jgi:hypothetical protein
VIKLGAEDVERGEATFTAGGADYALTYSVVEREDLQGTDLADWAADMFERSGVGGLWKAIDKSSLLTNVRKRRQKADEIDQVTSSFSGPTSVAYELARTQPRRYVEPSSSSTWPCSRRVTDRSRHSLTTGWCFGATSTPATPTTASLSTSTPGQENVPRPDPRTVRTVDLLRRDGPLGGTAVITAPTCASGGQTRTVSAADRRHAARRDTARRAGRYLIAAPTTDGGARSWLYVVSTSEWRPLAVTRQKSSVTGAGRGSSS